MFIILCVHVFLLPKYTLLIPNLPLKRVSSMFDMNVLFPTFQDFVVSVVITLLWLISSAAWAQGLVDIKYYSDFKESGFFSQICTPEGAVCKQTAFPNFGSLNVSIVSIKLVISIGVLIRSRLPTKWTGYNCVHDLAGRLLSNLSKLTVTVGLRIDRLLWPLGHLFNFLLRTLIYT
jgi:hypothetical protein